MGNCDTHVFLGSNSYKTVEYFSKALGEKTIERESISINRDKQHHRTGTSDSDQVMARALMTPDELRRLDNDLCIIFEKGIKPVKANKFYYFKHKNMENSLRRAEISHNDIGQIDRGTWRKFNPYNPWTEDKTENQVKDMKIESLDDLFDDEQSEQKEEVPNKVQKIKAENNNLNVNSRNEEQQNTNNISTISEDAFGDIEQEEIPKQAPIVDEEDTYDLQKELEAKFDELFGPIDDDNE